MFYYCESGCRNVITASTFACSIQGGPFETFQQAKMCARHHFPDDEDYGIFEARADGIYRCDRDGVPSQRLQGERL